MRRARWAAVVVAMAIGMFAAIPSAHGGNGVGNHLTIEKVVDGTAPEGTVFSVEVDCDEAGLVTVYFDETGHASDANGDQIASNEITTDPTDTCTVTETVDGDASSVAYECVEDPDAVRTECTDDNEVEFIDVVGDAATITVTNTFEPPPTTTTTTVPPTTPKPLVAVANFTG